MNHIHQLDDLKLHMDEWIELWYSYYIFSVAESRYEAKIITTDSLLVVPQYDFSIAECRRHFKELEY